MHFEFHKVKLTEGQMCGDVHLYIRSVDTIVILPYYSYLSDPGVSTDVKSVGKILSEEGLAEVRCSVCVCVLYSWCACAWEEDDFILSF